jgi:integrase
MSICQGRAKGRWRVTLWDPTAKRQREWVVKGLKRDADQFEARKKLELGVRGVVAAWRAVPKFSAFCLETYQPHAVATLKASTWKRARRYQLAELIEFFGDVRLDQLSEQMVEEYKIDCIDRGWRPNYTNGMLAALRTILRWAREAHALPVPPLKIKRLKPGKRRVRAWTMDEVRRLYAAAQRLSPWLVPLLHFLFATGCRKGEAIAAQWSWVDVDARMLRIPVTEQWQPKDKDERDIPISDALMAMLRARSREGSHIFVNQYGVPYAYFPETPYWAARDEAGLTGGVHQTRHTFASHFLKAQPDLSLLAEVMGHSTTYVTELYAHLLPEHLDRARNAVQLAPPGAAPPKRVRATK